MIIDDRIDTERLTERGGNGQAWYRACTNCKNGKYGDYCVNCENRIEHCRRLADYEDAEEQGRLIEFPVSIGDTLYYVPDWMTNKCIDKVTVKGYRLLNGNCQFIEISESEHHLISGLQNVNKIGKDFFRTMDEAKAKLKEMEDEDDKS